MRVVGTELSIDNKIQCDVITPPTPHEVIHSISNDHAKLEMLEFHSTDPVSAEDSTFRGFAVWLQYTSTVFLAYIKARIFVPDADHIMMAYNIPEGAGSCDDGECFGDLQISKIIKEKKLTHVAIFITRRKGNKNLGSRRFQVIRTITQELVTKLLSTTCEPVDCGWFTWGDEDVSQSPTPVFDPDDPDNARFMASLRGDAEFSAMGDDADRRKTPVQREQTSEEDMQL